MKANGINIIENALRENKGADVMVYISHCLYGDQKIKTQLSGIFNEEHIGFCVGTQKIYINKGDIVDYGINDGIYFADDVMQVRIKLNSAV
jgi:hypothetical protein